MKFFAYILLFSTIIACKNESPKFDPDAWEKERQLGENLFTISGEFFYANGSKAYLLANNKDYQLIMNDKAVDLIQQTNAVKPSEASSVEVYLNVALHNNPKDSLTYFEVKEILHIMDKRPVISINR
ncbi:MAG: hypothetical protein RQ756_06620 [Flavobacteriaceae bacterium]|nr:hypothetical protein [Flavobacteriaceae bacterium]